VVLYEYDCPKHGRFDQFNEIDGRNDMTCPKCGEKSTKAMSKSHVYMDFTEGFDHGLNTYVSTKAQRERLVEQKGLKRYKD
jgi:putative FmdB family regulatory protein